MEKYHKRGRFYGIGDKLDERECTECSGSGKVGYWWCNPDA